MEPEASPAAPRVTEADFESLFRSHFRGLHAYAITIIKDQMAAEDIVQQTFFRLWERRESIPQLQSVAAYLYRSVYNECLNFLKHAKVKTAYQAHALHQGEGTVAAAGKAELGELERRLDRALQELPEACRTIFQLSRFGELKYREIADRLGLSVKTVENQMGKALRILRDQLADFLPVLLLMLHHL